MELGGKWSEAKVKEFKRLYLAFERTIFINSKELGGRARLSDSIYWSQERLLDGICDGLSADIHDFKVLKSRQLGITTRARAIGLFWLGLFDGMQGAMIFDSAPNMAKARREIEAMMDGLPARLDFPRKVSFNRDMLILSNQSTLQFIAAGVKRSGSSRALGASLGINLLLASEMATWGDKEGIVSLRQSLAKQYPNRLFVWESTARGYGGIWHSLWEEAKQDPDSQKTMFLGWWLHPGQTIARDDSRFARYGADEPTSSEQARIASVKTEYGWDVTREQLAWYRWISDPTREREEGDPEDASLIQEQPWTETEAFQMTGSSFFAAQTLAERMDVASRARPVANWRFFPGTDFLTARFEPARTRREVDLVVWEEPVYGSTYVVSADPAFGHSARSDRSACTVLRCFADCVEQVAEFTSVSVSTHQFAWLIAAVVGWYCMEGKNPVVPIIELNGPGEAVWREYSQLRQLVTSGYLNIEAKERGLQSIFHNVRQYVFNRSDSMTSGHNYHWKTTLQLKIAIMERLRDFVHTGGILIRSPAALDEMRSVSRDGDSIAAEGTGKDDRVMALAMGIRAWEERLRRPLVAQGRTKSAETAQLLLSPGARLALFTRHTLDTFLNRNRKARIARTAAEARAQWAARRVDWRR